MRALILILIPLLSACGRFESDPAFTPYVDEFRSILNDAHVASQNWELELKFGEPTQSITGECDSGDIQSTIVIDKGMWNTLGETERRLLVYHELGHCVLGRKHLESAHMEGTELVPDSIMFPNSATAARAFERDPKKYTDELTASSPKDGGL